MSKLKRPEFRKAEVFIPETYRTGPSGYVPHRVRKYNLNLGDTEASGRQTTRGTYQVEKPKKIGRIHTWILRNPLKFHIIGVGLGLSIFFSRPIYDLFIGEAVEGPRPKVKRGYQF